MPPVFALHSGNTVILLPQHPEPCLDQDSEPQDSGLFLETHLIRSCPQWLPSATDSSWPPRKLGKSISLPDILFYHRSLPPWHPWPLRAVGTPLSKERRWGGGAVETHLKRLTEGTALCTVLSQNANAVMFIMFPASKTTVWQQRQLAAP